MEFAFFSLGKPLHLYCAIIDDNKFCFLVYPAFVDCIQLFAVDKSTNMFVSEWEESACRETFTHVIEGFLILFSARKIPSWWVGA